LEKKLKSKAVYPGTFDPITYGHLDIIKRGLLLFDEIIIAVAESSTKDILFSIEERIDFVRETTKDMKNVSIMPFKGLVVDFVKKMKARIILRGIRMISDFEYEFQMALTNRRFAPDIETIFLMPSENYSYISSKLIKESAALGANLSYFVPIFVEEALKEKLKK
jgi:pantetheine-phosphate adenylyltransferase